jgi:hypothetical protein
MLAPPDVTKIEKKEEESETPEPLQSEANPRVKHIIRGINAQKQYGSDGSEPVNVVESYLDSQLMQGYKLFYVQHLRSNHAPEGNTVMSEQMLYVLVRE